MNALALFTAAFYLLAIFAALHYLVNPHPQVRLPVFASAMSALVCHILWLSHDVFVHDIPQQFNILHIASLVGFVMCAFLTAIAQRFKAWQLLPMAYGFSLILLLATFIFPVDFSTTLEISPLSLLHLGLSVLAYTIFLIATLLAVQQLYLNYKLKTHRPELPSLTPSLMTIEQRLLTLITTGQVVLTGAIVVGFLFIHSMHHSQHAHKILLSLVAWGIYSTLIVGHFKYGLRGKRSIWICLFGTLMLTLAYFGSHMIHFVQVNAGL